MAINSETFGSVKLSGKDAQKFAQQVKQKPNAAAVASAENGRSMIQAMRNNKMTFTIRPQESKRADGKGHGGR